MADDLVILSAIGIGRKNMEIDVYELERRAIKQNITFPAEINELLKKRNCLQDKKKY